MTERYILHADLDAFYASVEQLDHPELRGKPVVVGGAPESRGVVAAASYEARKFGIRSAMPMWTAVQRCPALVRMPPRFSRYREMSKKIMGIFLAVTPIVEPLSLDEAYLDITSVVAADGAGRCAGALKTAVRRETGLAVTIGGGTSKTVAKVASRKGKPDGLLLVPPGQERAFLAPLAVDFLWGVGPKTAEWLKQHGIATVGQLASADLAWLQRAFGRRGPDLRERALGIDESPVTTSRETKSVSAETTMASDVEKAPELADIIAELADGVSSRLQRAGLKGRTVCLKLRLSDFATFTRQTTLPFPTDSAEVIRAIAAELMRREMRQGRRFRLVGVSVSNFQETLQMVMALP